MDTMTAAQMEIPTEARANGERATAAVLGTVLATIRLALADRALVWAALLAAIAFTAWALAAPSPWRLGGAAGYAALIFWPVLFLDAQRRKRA